jgi:hypothetical protein
VVRDKWIVIWGRLLETRRVATGMGCEVFMDANWAAWLGIIGLSLGQVVQDDMIILGQAFKIWDVIGTDYS